MWYPDIRRGFIAPKGIPEANLTFLRNVFKKMAADPGYIKEMEEAVNLKITWTVLSLRNM